MDLKTLKEFCTTERQHQILDARIGESTDVAAAKKLGTTRQAIQKTIDRLKKKAIAQGYSPKHDMNHTVPEGFGVKGVSTLYDKDGKVSVQWVKSAASKELQLELLQESIEALTQEIQPAKPIPKPKKHTSKDLLTLYPFGDPHIGLATYFSETGIEYDLASAELLFTAAMQRAVANAPNSEQALIVNVGDYFHSDNAQNRTRKSGNSLDTSGSFTDRLKIGIRIMKKIIELALTKHGHVKVINTIGNHDEHMSIALSAILEAFYANEPRVEIPVIEQFYQYHRFHQCLFGVTHGDQCKPGDLEGIMAADQAEAWGQTQFRYWLTGHIHHDVIKEFRGCKFESFRTLAPKDAWHTTSGYRSDRDMKVLVFHKDHGEVERYTVNLTQFAHVLGNQEVA